MQYFGGKAKIAKHIATYLESVRKENQPYLEPFVGGANIVSQMSGERYASDFNEYLVAMYKGVQQGCELPDELSEERYQHIKNNKDENKVLTGFVGFGCSFAGKWFGGYARDKRKSCDFAHTSKVGLLKKMKTMRDVAFEWKDYKTLEPKGMLVYCDPPYKGTTKYSGTPDFDSDEFWEVMRKWSMNNDVYISEYKAPNDFISVLEIPTKTCIRNASDNASKRIEKLFTYRR